MVLPVSAGSHERSLQCFRALGVVEESITVAFLGGGLEMEEEDWHRVNQQTTNRAVSQTTGTGTLLLRIDVLTTWRANLSNRN